MHSNFNTDLMTGETASPEALRENSSSRQISLLKSTLQFNAGKTLRECCMRERKWFKLCINANV